MGHGECECVEHESVNLGYGEYGGCMWSELRCGECICVGMWRVRWGIGSEVGHVECTCQPWKGRRWDMTSEKVGHVGSVH